MIVSHSASSRPQSRARRFAEDWVPDLAEEIGSVRWFQGLGAMSGLMFLALAFWPDFSDLDARSAELDVAVQRTFRQQIIQPLARGGGQRPIAATSAIVPLAMPPERPSIETTLVLMPGETLTQALQRAGSGKEDARRASELVATIVPLETIEPGTRIAIALGLRVAPEGPRRLERLRLRPRLGLELSLRRQGRQLTVAALPVAIDNTPLRFRGTIGADFRRSALAAGAPIDAIRLYMAAMQDYVGFNRDIVPGDTFDMIVSSRRAAAGEVQVGELLYAGLDREAKPLVELVRLGGEEQLHAVTGRPRTQAAAWRSGRIAPVQGRITSSYGPRRHPLLGYTRMHGGVDFAAAWGSPILAAAAGTVSRAGRHGGHGNYVRLEHGGGSGTGYGHMSRIAVAPGMRVRRGQVIGYVGSTGLSTGPHLHFEMYENGRRVNPLGSRLAAPVPQDHAGRPSSFQKAIAALKAIGPSIVR